MSHVIKIVSPVVVYNQLFLYFNYGIWRLLFVHLLFRKCSVLPLDLETIIFYNLVWYCVGARGEFLDKEENDMYVYTVSDQNYHKLYLASLTY